MMQNPLQRASIESLQEDKTQLSGELSDPLTADKSFRLSKLSEINSELLSRDAIAYFCEHCRFQHKGGQIYHDHKKYAHILYHYPPVKIYFPEKTYSIELENIGIYKSEEFLLDLPTGTIFDLRIEKDRVLVKYETEILGNLNISHRRHEELTQMLNRSGVIVKCFLTHYQPREMERIIVEKWIGSQLIEKTHTTKEHIPEQAILTITLFDIKKYKEIFQGLVELIVYHPDPIPAFLALGIRGMRDLELISQEKKNPPLHASFKEFHTKIHTILDELHQYFKLGSPQTDKTHAFML